MQLALICIALLAVAAPYFGWRVGFTGWTKAYSLWGFPDLCPQTRSELMLGRFRFPGITDGGLVADWPPLAQQITVGWWGLMARKSMPLSTCPVMMTHQWAKITSTWSRRLILWNMWLSR